MGILFVSRGLISLRIISRREVNRSQLLLRNPIISRHIVVDQQPMKNPGVADAPSLVLTRIQPHYRRNVDTAYDRCRAGRLRIARFSGRWARGGSPVGNEGP